MSQYLDAGQRTLNIATNGGLTIVAVVRFRSSCASAKRQEGASCPLTGTPGNSERFIDLGSGQNDNNLLVARVGTTTNLTVQIRNNQSIIATATVSGAIVQNSWLTVVVTYRANDMLPSSDFDNKDTSIMTLQGERVAGTPISILSRKMTTLNLAGNELTTLPSDVFFELSDLKMLCLRSNSLTELPADVFSGLNNLMSLDVSRNMLSDLLPGVFTGLSNLESLVLTYNKFHHLPLVLSDLTALTVLDVWEGNHDGIWTEYQGG